MTARTALSAGSRPSGGLIAGIATPVQVAPTQARAASHMKSGDLVLRMPTEDDRTAYLQAVAASRTHLLPWFPLNEPGESDEVYVDRQIAQARAGQERGTDWRRCAFTPDGVFAGVVNINRITRTDVLWHASINWWVATFMTECGIATAMVSAALDHAFGEIPGGLQLDLVHAEIDDANTPSVRLASRLGFVSDPVPAVMSEINGVQRLETIWTARRPADLVVRRTRHADR